MDTCANNFPENADSPATGQSDRSASLTNVALRDNAHLAIIRPSRQSKLDVPLEMPGTYFCVSFTGEASILSGQGAHRLTNGKLHILRQVEPSLERSVKFGSASSAGCLAVLVFFSLEWCAACPQGPNCRVARFLLDGGASNGEVDDLELELDNTGSAIARSLLNCHIDHDIDALRVERSFLAILSWAYGKHTLPEQNPEWTSSLHPKATNRTRQAAEVIRQRLDDPPTIAELSTLVGMNESDLKRCFKCLYGTTIASYSRRIRLEAARDLLAHSSLGIARIALEIGFSSPSQFARAFRLHFGHNPAEYRRLPSQML